MKRIRKVEALPIAAIQVSIGASGVNVEFATSDPQYDDLVRLAAAAAQGVLDAGLALSTQESASELSDGITMVCGSHCIAGVVCGGDGLCTKVGPHDPCVCPMCAEAVPAPGGQSRDDVTVPCGMSSPCLAPCAEIGIHDGIHACEDQVRLGRAEGEGCDACNRAARAFAREQESARIGEIGECEHEWTLGVPGREDLVRCPCGAIAERADPEAGPDVKPTVLTQAPDWGSVAAEAARDEKILKRAGGYDYPADAVESAADD